MLQLIGLKDMKIGDQWSHTWDLLDFMMQASMRKISETSACMTT